MISSVKSKPKFRVVEGLPHIENSEIYEDFKADYLSVNITKKEMLEKYDISNNQYDQLRKKVAEETGVNRKASKTQLTKVWTHHTRFIDYMKAIDKFRVSKFINGSHNHYGVYDDLDTAIYVRDRLEANNWSYQTYKDLRFELFGEEDNKTKIERIYNDFKKDWLNGESMKFLTRKYKIGNNTYKVLSKMIRSETGIERKPQLHYKVMRKHERSLNGCEMKYDISM